MTTHIYSAALTWTGSTADYASYDRDHRVATGGGALDLSADPAFRGDPARTNPEQLLVAAASSCQLLSFLGAASRSGVDVIGYEDDAEGLMPESGRAVRVTSIVLRPRITVRGADPDRVLRLVRKAHANCYIANSLSTAISIEARVEVL